MNATLLELLLLAGLAGFVLFRLYATLGRRTGHEQPPEAPPPVAEAAPTGNLRPAFTGAAAAGLEAIAAADPGFEPKGFLAGARTAYEWIVGAFADGDLGKLEDLLAPPVFARYKTAIEAREKDGRRQLTDLVRITATEIEKATLDNGVARVTVRFAADLASAILSKDGETVEGDPSRIRRSEEDWTFERDTRTGDPNWRLSTVAKT